MSLRRGHSGRVDGNHGVIAKRFREHHFSFQSLASIGDGCPDGLIAKAGKMALVEIKAPKKHPNEAQIAWMLKWNSDDVFIVRTVEGVDRIAANWK